MFNYFAMANGEAPADCSSRIEEQLNRGHDGELGFVAVISPPLSGICDRNEVETIDVLRLTWGLVLGIYTGASDISFGCIRRETADDGSPVKEWLHRMAIERSTPIIELLKQGSSSNSHQNGGLEDIASQSLAPGRCDTVLMLDVGFGGAAEALGRRDMVNVSTANCRAATHSVCWVYLHKCR